MRLHFATGFVWKNDSRCNAKVNRSLDILSPRNIHAELFITLDTSFYLSLYVWEKLITSLWELQGQKCKIADNFTKCSVSSNPEWRTELNFCLQWCHVSQIWGDSTNIFVQTCSAPFFTITLLFLCIPISLEWNKVVDRTWRMFVYNV